MTRRDALVAGLFAAGLAAWLAPLARLGVDQHHDGIMLKPALDVLSGQVLFRDSFTQYGALTTYLQALALWLRPSLLSLRLLTVAAYAITSFFLYAAWRMILPRSLTIVSCALFFLFIPAYEKDYWNNEYWLMLPWSSVYALMFQSLAIYALFQVIRGVRPKPWAVLLGLTCACVFWCRQPVGVIMTACLVAIWFALQLAGWSPAGQTRRAIAGCILTGFAAVNVLLLGHLLVSGAWSDWWYQNLVWPSRWSESTGWLNTVKLSMHAGTFAGGLVLLLAAALPGLIGRFRPGLSPRGVLAFYLCIGGVLAWQHDWLLRVVDLRAGGWSILFPLAVLLQAVMSTVPAFATRSTPKSPEYYLVAVLAGFSLGSLVQYYPVADPWHIVWSLAPAFGLVTFALWRSSGWPAPVMALALTAAFLPAAWAKVRSTTHILAQPVVTLTRPASLAGMRVPAAQARTYERIVAVLDPVLKLQPDIPSALIGNDALFLCFTNNRFNPSPYYVTWRGLATNAINLNRWSNIQRVRPLMFLYQARWDAVNDFYRRTHYVPLVYLPEEALEIAVPQELADALGVTAYGAARAGVQAPNAPKP